MKTVTTLWCVFFALVLAVRAETWDFSGEWATAQRVDGESLLCNLNINQEGNQIVGRYSPNKGRLEGKVKGNVAWGTWEENGSSGEFRFDMEESGNSWRGWWKYDGDSKWRGVWNASGRR